MKRFPNARQGPIRPRRSQFEALEGRQLLAGDLIAQWIAEDLNAEFEDGATVTSWPDSVGGVRRESEWYADPKKRRIEWSVGRSI